jgi:hypothetical protein
MNTAAFNSDEMLKTMAAEAVKRQAQVRSAVRDVTLKALHARELGLAQINAVVRSVTAGVNAGLGDKGDMERSSPMPLPVWTMRCSRSSRLNRWR